MESKKASENAVQDLSKAIENKNMYEQVLSQRIRPEPEEEDMKETQDITTETMVAESTKRKTYDFSHAVQESTAYFGGDSLAAGVWVNKYALKDSEGNLYECTPDDMHRRIASEIARIEARYANPMTEEQIFKLLRHFKYIVPQGSPMAGIGNPFQIGSLSNCFVIGNKGEADSYGGIMKVDEEQVQLMKRRGGVGHDLSHIRPKGSQVLNSALTSTGLVPLWSATPIRRAR